MLFGTIITNRLSLVFLFFIFSLNISFAQKIEELSDTQVKEFIKRTEDMRMSEADIEKYALSRGYTMSDISKLKERIAQVKSPTRVSNTQSTTYESRKLPSTADSTNQKENLQQITAVKKDILEIFGANIFSSKGMTFEPNLRIATPKTYVLGVDDELTVDIYGNAQMSYKQKVSNEGTIKFENLAPIMVNGLTIETATDRIVNRLKSLYYGLNSQGSGIYANITLSQIRSIKVSVIGEAARPGTYTVPSLATVFNVLVQAGGPSKNGSFRNILLIRDNKVIKRLDLYDFLINADMRDNATVKDQDVIKINDYETRVQISGQVKRPAIYEINKGENLKTLLNFAGNFNEMAYKKSIKVTRVGEKELEIIDVATTDAEQFIPQLGDAYTVDKVSNNISNSATLTGAVYRPGVYSINNEIKTVKQLIQKAEGITNEAFLKRGIIIREGIAREKQSISFDLGKLLNGEIEDIALVKSDSIRIFSNLELKEEFFVSINGEINKPNRYIFKKGMTLSDLVIEAGGYTLGASESKIEVARRVISNDISNKTSVNIIEINGQKNLEINGIDQNFLLEPFDVISIKTLPSYNTQKRITIYGEVLYPGNFVLNNTDEKLADVIKRAGGVKETGFLKGGKILRKDKIISVDFELAIKKNESINNIQLIEFDTIYIPKYSNTVEIQGGVHNNATVAYSSSKNLKKYIQDAGGFTNVSLPRKTFVTYPSGYSAYTKSFLFLKFHPRIEPGSTITVPTFDPKEIQRITAIEKATIVTAFTSVLGILYSIIKPIIDNSNAAPAVIQPTTKNPQ